MYTFQIHILEEGSSGREIYMLSYVKIICLKCHPQKGVYKVHGKGQTKQLFLCSCELHTYLWFIETTTT